jgi:guanine nucleotide-binding protein alpha-1 subunit
VIQLNLVQSFHLILDAFTREQTADPASRPFALAPDLLKSKARLAPLLELEEALRKRLVPEGSDEREPTMLDRTKSFVREIAVQANWKSSWGKGEEKEGADENGERIHVGPDDDEAVWNDTTNPNRILFECSTDMIRLWNDPMTHQLLAYQKLRMEEVAGL